MILLHEALIFFYEILCNLVKTCQKYVNNLDDFKHFFSWHEETLKKSYRISVWWWCFRKIESCFFQWESRNWTKWGKAEIGKGISHPVLCPYVSGKGTQFSPPSTFFVVQWLSPVQVFAIPLSAAHQPSLSFTMSWSLLKFMSAESVMPSNRLILCHPLLFLPSIFPTIRVFSNESVLRIRWPKDWSFSFSISPSNEYSMLISFRMDWFDLLLSKGLSRVFSSPAVQKHQFFSAQPSLWSTSPIRTWLVEKNSRKFPQNSQVLAHVCQEALQQTIFTSFALK